MEYQIKLVRFVVTYASIKDVYQERWEEIVQRNEECDKEPYIFPFFGYFYLPFNNDIRENSHGV